MLRWFEEETFCNSILVARGAVVKGASMERSQFLEGESAVESILWTEMEVGVVKFPLKCVKDAVSGLGWLYCEAERLFPCSEE